MKKYKVRNGSLIDSLPGLLMLAFVVIVTGLGNHFLGF